MLGKIIKYDMKAMNRFLIIIHAFLLIYAFFIRILITGRLTANNVHNFGNTYFLILGLTVSFGIILLTCVAFATSIIIAVHFYKSTYSDEGYLTHTLPVKKGTLLIAKVIAGTIWCIIDIIGLFAAIYIAAWVPYVKDSLSGNKALLMEIFGLGSHLGVFGSIAFYIFFIIAGTVANVILYYACISLGQIFTGHRVFGAVAMYFIVTFVESISCFLIFIPLGLLNTQAVTIGTSTTLYMSTPSQYMLGLLGISLALMVIWSVILYIITYYRLNRRLNLA